MATLTIASISAYLREKIAGWYRNASADYGHTGKFISAEIFGNDLRIVWEEYGKPMETIIPWYAEYGLEQLYNIWMGASTGWFFVEDEGHAVTQREMYAYGCHDPAMLPLNADEAVKIFENSKCELLALHRDGGEHIVESMEDLNEHADCDGMFGIYNINVEIIVDILAA